MLKYLLKSYLIMVFHGQFKVFINFWHLIFALSFSTFLLSSLFSFNPISFFSSFSFSPFSFQSLFFDSFLFYPIPFNPLFCFPSFSVKDKRCSIKPICKMSIIYDNKTAKAINSFSFCNNGLSIAVNKIHKQKIKTNWSKIIGLGIN